MCRFPVWLHSPVTAGPRPAGGQLAVTKDGTVDTRVLSSIEINPVKSAKGETFYRSTV